MLAKCKDGIKKAVNDGIKKSANEVVSNEDANDLRVCQP